jgi:hypothetical protein
MSMPRLTLIMLGSVGVVHSEMVWPSKYDLLEDMIAMQSGYIRPGFTDGKTGSGIEISIRIV